MPADVIRVKGWKTRRIRCAAPLLPVSQGGDGKMEGFRKFSLRHSETLAQHFDTRYSSHLGQLRARERLRVGVGPRGS